LSVYVRVFELLSGAWVQAGSDIGGNTNDFLGKAVAISADGKIVAGGSRWMAFAVQCIGVLFGIIEMRLLRFLNFYQKIHFRGA